MIVNNFKIHFESSFSQLLQKGNAPHIPFESLKMKINIALTGFKNIWTALYEKHHVQVAPLYSQIKMGTPHCDKFLAKALSKELLCVWLNNPDVSEVNLHLCPQKRHGYERVKWQVFTEDLSRWPVLDRLTLLTEFTKLSVLPSPTNR